jgi:hypothetical protein
MVEWPDVLESEEYGDLRSASRSMKDSRIGQVDVPVLRTLLQSSRNAIRKVVSSGLTSTPGARRLPGPSPVAIARQLHRLSPLGPASTVATRVDGISRVPRVMIHDPLQSPLLPKLDPIELHRQCLRCFLARHRHELSKPGR